MEQINRAKVNITNTGVYHDELKEYYYECDDPANKDWLTLKQLWLLAYNKAEKLEPLDTAYNTIVSNDFTTTTSNINTYDNDSSGSLWSIITIMGAKQDSVQDLWSQLAQVQQQIATLSIQQQQMVYYAKQQQLMVLTMLTMPKHPLQMSYTPQIQQIIAPTIHHIPSTPNKNSAHNGSTPTHASASTRVLSCTKYRW